MKPKTLEEAKMLMGNDANVVLPQSDQRADWYQPGWIYFCYYPFEVRFTLPYPNLANDVLNSLRIAPV